jgi:hypothetical protein
VENLGGQSVDVPGMPGVDRIKHLRGHRFYFSLHFFSPLWFEQLSAESTVK